MTTQANNDDVQAWMESLGWKLGKTSGAWVRSGFQAGHPGYGMMTQEAAESLYTAMRERERQTINQFENWRQGRPATAKRYVGFYELLDEYFSNQDTTTEKEQS